ncbi:MAG: hypothetical protein Q6362_005985 [Candidatus Wukongarchaeota archaeon]|nr:hypothetical protein [Candidatus Wukongarchaeota archaeon]MDO8128979.1 hypothetical protein [Candidatus Wukongarchaeota archaeon]
MKHLQRKKLRNYAEIMKNCPRLLASGTTLKIFYAVYKKYRRKPTASLVVG